MTSSQTETEKIKKKKSPCGFFHSLVIFAFYLFTSPKVCGCPDQMRGLSEKVSDLELKLEKESQQKEEAMTTVEMLNSRVAELELQLQTEAQQRTEATENAEMLQLRVADLEKQLEDQNHAHTESEQVQ